MTEEVIEKWLQSGAWRSLVEEEKEEGRRGVLLGGWVGRKDGR